MQLHLIRHGHHALLGHVLCGRMPEVELDAQGRQQMMETAELIGHRAPRARGGAIQPTTEEQCSLPKSSQRISTSWKRSHGH